MTKEEVLKQIESQFDFYRTARARSKYDDLSDLGPTMSNLVLTRLAATIDRLAPESSRYKKNMYAALQRYGETNALNTLVLMGILEALRADYEAEFLVSVEEQIHADIFTDFLEMAHYLLKKKLQGCSSGNRRRCARRASTEALRAKRYLHGQVRPPQEC